MRPAPWLSLALGLLALAAAALDHFYSNDFYLNTRNTPPAIVPLPVAPRLVPAPPARRVVVLVVDGLGVEAALREPAFQRLAARGAVRPLLAEPLSFTDPGMTSLVTGVSPYWSGVRLNADRAAPPLPTLLTEARRAGLSASHSNGDWEGVEGLLDDQPRLSPPSALCGPGAARGLTWLYVGGVDVAGHRYGAASEEYRAQARSAGRYAEAIAACLDLRQDVLFVVSEHGHLARGGHGGGEEEARRALFLAVGARVRGSSRLALRPMVDAAPTVALWLGLTPPRAAQGRPMLDLLDATPHEAARWLAPGFLLRAARESLDARWFGLGARLSLGEKEALVQAEVLLGAWSVRRDVGRAAEAERRAWARLWWGLPLLLGVVALWGAFWRAGLRASWRDGLPALVYAASFVVLYLATGNRVSWSLPRGEAVFLLETLCDGLAAAWCAARVSRRRGRIQEETLWIVVGLGAPYWLAALWEGNDPVYLVSPEASFAVLLAPTFAFYGHIVYAVWCLRLAWRGR